MSKNDNMISFNLQFVERTFFLQSVNWVGFVPHITTRVLSGFCSALTYRCVELF